MTKIPRLFQLMEEKKISAVAVSRATGISCGNISDWKSGRSMPGARQLAELADFLGTNTDYLLERTDIALSAQDIGIAVSAAEKNDPQLSRLRVLLSSASDEQLSAIEKLFSSDK